MSEPDVATRIVRALVDRTAREIAAPSEGAKTAIGRARAHRRLRIAGVLTASLVATAALVLPLIMLLALRNYRESPSQTPPTPDSVILDEGGLRLMVPAGWLARADFLSGYTRKILQVATFPLPPLSDAEATSARALIGPHDVLIVMVEHQDPCGGSDPMFPRMVGPVSIEARDFGSPHDVCDPPLPALRDVPEDHALARKTFEL
jgi:hypothetical protein